MGFRVPLQFLVGTEVTKEVVSVPTLTHDHDSNTRRGKIEFRLWQIESLIDVR